MNKFPLEALLKLRRFDRDRRREELAAARRAEDRLVRQTQLLADEQDRAARQRREAVGPGPLDVTLLMESNAYQSALRDDEKRLQRRRDEQRTDCESRRAALIEADRAAKTLEKLGEKHQLRRRQDQLRQAARDF